MRSKPGRDGFRVIIAGGGVAGLALANTLQEAKIDYVLLEARTEIAPQIGASIGVMPNGSRILDQLGLFEELEKHVEPILWLVDRDKKGDLIYPKFDGAQLIKSRCGYSPAFGERQTLLQIMYDNIIDKEKILLGKTLSRVEQTSEGVKVQCSDGTLHEGDILAGADGVWSKTRQEMWRLADALKPGLITSEEKNCMSAEYVCLYGIGYAVPGLDSGELNTGYDKDVSTLIVTGKQGKNYFFVFEKLDKVYRMGNIPRFTAKEELEYAERHCSFKITPELTFGDVWKQKVSSKLVALEEADFRTWTFGRVACVGDNVHKMTPNAGAGGNASIESAAALTNAINAMLDKASGRPSQHEVEACLREYQLSRKVRVTGIIKSSNMVTRIQAMAGFKETFFVNYVIKNLGEVLLDMQANFYVGATMLSFLPPPRRSLDVNMPYNPQQGEGKQESVLKRALLALPLLGLMYLAVQMMDATIAFPWVGELLKAGTIQWTAGEVPLRPYFYGLPWLDELWRGIIVFFTPSIYGYDDLSRRQMITFLSDLGTLLAIMLVESTRRSNKLTLAQQPMMFFMLAQFRGIGVIFPLYCFFHYILSPIANFKSTDQRLTKMAYTAGIVPTLTVCYYIPTAAMFFWPTLSGRQSWNWVWQMSPLWIGLTHRLLAATVFPDTTTHDRLHAPKRDYPSIQLAVGTCIAVSSGVWLWTFLTAPRSIIAVMIPTTVPQSHSDLTAFTRVFLQYDHVFCFAAALTWLAYLFWDMKHAGMVTERWSTLLLYAAASVAVLGPGATVGLGWLWREDVITNKRHKDAITSSWAAEWSKGAAKTGKIVESRSPRGTTHMLASSRVVMD